MTYSDAVEILGRPWLFKWTDCLNALLVLWYQPVPA